MPNGFGFRGGWGFGFRGSSPPWPYIGLGRGGLPRCGYFLSGAAGAPLPLGYGAYPYYGSPGAMPFYGGQAAAPGATPFAPGMAPGQEFDFLKNQAQTMRAQLEEIESRIRELESEE